MWPCFLCLLIILSSMPRCHGVMLWREPGSCWVFWCDAALFSALRSSDFCLNIRRDESPFSSHTRCEWSFVLPESSGDSKGRAQWLVSLSTVRSNMPWNTKIVRICLMLSMRGSSWLNAKWNYLNLSKATQILQVSVYRGCTFEASLQSSYE